MLFACERTRIFAAYVQIVFQFFCGLVIASRGGRPSPPFSGAALSCFAAVCFAKGPRAPVDWDAAAHWDGPRGAAPQAARAAAYSAAADAERCGSPVAVEQYDSAAAAASRGFLRAEHCALAERERCARVERARRHWADAARCARAECSRSQADSRVWAARHLPEQPAGDLPAAPWGGWEHSMRVWRDGPAAPWPRDRPVAR